eukprot:UN32668
MSIPYYEVKGFFSLSNKLDSICDSTLRDRLAKSEKQFKRKTVVSLWEMFVKMGFRPDPTFDETFFQYHTPKQMLKVKKYLNKKREDEKSEVLKKVETPTTEKKKKRKRKRRK